MNMRRPTLALQILKGPGFVTRMVVVTLLLVFLATLASGAAAYFVAIFTVEDEIEFAGQSLVHSLSGAIVTIVSKPGAQGELQVILNQALAIDTEGRVADAAIISKDLQVLAAKDTTRVGTKYSTFSGLKDLSEMQTVHIRDRGTRIVSPVQWGRKDKRTLGYVVLTLSEHAFWTARRAILLAFSIVFALAALGTVFITRRVLRRLLEPVVELGNAARALAEGDSDYPLEPKSNDEIGAATHSFLNMRAAQSVFVRFSNPALVQEILEGRAPDVRVEVKLAVGFGDGVRFTDWSSAHTAREIGSLLTDYFTLFGQMVTPNGGIIEKFMGDAVMTYCGLHGKDSAESSRQSIRIHIAGQHLLRLANEAFAHYHQRRVLTFRFGLATGRCVVGPMGARGVKLDYTIIGDTVNLASRLEGLAAPGGVAVDRFTYLNVDGASTVQATGPEHKIVKGFFEPIEIYHVAGFRAAPEIERLRQILIDTIRSEPVKEVLRLTHEQFEEFFANAEGDIMSDDLLLPLPEEEA